ncbi:MFS transporter [Candidatus Poriferisodalis sp.]|uniref:MFS transporter n=1 Tax=Candidatus Poriferisodalis sp. TaxID=3101277 RepID=UPI003B59DB7F
MASGPTHLDSARGWVTACGAALSVMAAFGTIYSFNAFAKSMADEFGTGHGPISLVFGITVFLFFGSALVSGRLYDRFGIAPLLIVGGAMFCGGLFAMSQISVLWHGYVLFGVGLGFGGGLFNAPLFALTAMWFVRHRAVAQGIVATGSGLGTMLFAPLAQWLLEVYGWRGGMKALAVVAAGIFAVALFMIKQPPKMDMGDAKRHVSLVVRSAAFWQMSASGVFFTVAVIGSLGSVVTFAQDDGLPPRAAVALFTIIGFSGIVGRMALTSLARPLGSVRLLKIAFFGLPVAYAIWFATTRVSGLETKFALLIVFASVLGVSYGGFVALLGHVTAHLFGLAGLGTVMGMLFFCSGTGALIGPPLMGFTADATGDIGLPIAISGVIAAVGVVVLLPMTRHPLPLPTYMGPPGVPPTQTSSAPIQRPVREPLIPQRLFREPAVPMVRPLADRTAEALERPRSASLRDAPPDVFWPIPDDDASDRNGAAVPVTVADLARSN